MAKDKVEVTKGSVYKAIHEDAPEKAAEMIVKADLVRAIIAIKESRGLTQTQLGEIIDMNQSDVSRMFKGNFRNIAIGKIMNCLVCLNRDVRIVVERSDDKSEVGTLAALVG